MTQELRDKMYRIQGMLEAIRFPVVEAPTAYYDLVDSIAEQYESVLKEVNGMTASINTPKASCCSVHAGGYEECPEECEHVADGTFYAEALREDIDYKCKKCGEFYR